VKNIRESTKKVIRLFVPTIAVLFLARLGRLYIRHAPFQFGKQDIVKGKTIFRLCDTCKLSTTATTEFGTRHKIRFPDLIQKYIFYFGVWEPAITTFLRGSLSSGDRFVDVGANIGYYTCLASQLVGPSGRIYAIEASPNIYKTLLENLDLNEAENVHTINNAVFDRETTLSVFLESEGNIGHTSVFEKQNNKLISEQVKALPLHKLFNPQELYSARLIKIDVEGAEWFVINGVKEHLDRFSPETEWLIEINPTDIQEHGGNINELITPFIQLGYKLYTIDNLYDVDWYIKQRHRYMACSVDGLLNPAPENISSQVDVLFTKRSYP
jgi:FkbM family methyltransferase